jgi:hypothetical protein
LDAVRERRSGRIAETKYPSLMKSMKRRVGSFDKKFFGHGASLEREVVGIGKARETESALQTTAPQRGKTVMALDEGVQRQFVACALDSGKHRLCWWR